MSSLERIVESLLFLSPEPVSTAELAESCDVTEAEIDRAVDLLGASLAERGVVLREVAGGYSLAAHPDAEQAARRLLARPKT
ncbi:MAG: SMC-Scp complex subunit ScpB, partial [Solirubrobacterales bacterium]